MKLTDKIIEGLKPRLKQYKASDGLDLYILVTPRGSKLWRMNYRFEKKQRTLSFGRYPFTTLEHARAQCHAAKTLIAEGLDPMDKVKRRKLVAMIRQRTSFASVAEEYLEKRRKEGLATATLKKKVHYVELACRGVGDLPVDQIKPIDVLAILRVHEEQGHYETAHRVRALIGQVMRYAVATARAEQDPTPVLRGALITPPVRNLPAITNRDAFAELVRRIWHYEHNSEIVPAALKLMVLLYPRPGELRHARWSDFDFEEGVWSIPAENTKMRRLHRKPLSAFVMRLLRELRRISPDSDLIVPSKRNPDRPISENTMNLALRRLGYSGDRMTSHGFRSSASSLLNESGLWNPDAIEAELDHRSGSRVRRIYHRAEYWEERVQMAAWWAREIELISKHS